MISFINPFIEWSYYKIKIYYQNKKVNDCQTLEQMEVILEPTVNFNFAYKLAAIVVPIYIAQLFSACLPFIYVFLAFGYVIFYYQDKWILTRQCVIPDTFDRSLVVVAVGNLFHAVTMGMLLVIWIYGSPGMISIDYYLDSGWVNNAFGLKKNFDNMTTFSNSFKVRIEKDIKILIFIIIMLLIVMFFRVTMVWFRVYRDKQEISYFNSRKRGYDTTGEPAYSLIKLNLGYTGIMSYNLVDQPGYKNYMPLFNAVRNIEGKEVN